MNEKNEIYFYGHLYNKFNTWVIMGFCNIILSKITIFMDFYV